MGKLEVEAQKRFRKEYLKEIILASVAAAGLMSVVLVAPNIIQALSKLGIIKKTRNSSINRSIDRLINKNLLVLEKTERGAFVRLTPRGELVLERLQDNPRLLKKPKRWDKRWRIVIYDLKESKKNLRDKLRVTLASFGFIKIQDSVWVYPYDCEDLITLIKADFKIGREVLYIIADSVENDKYLKKIFGLPIS